MSSESRPAALPNGVTNLIKHNYDIFSTVKALLKATPANPMSTAEIARTSGFDRDTTRGICLKLSNRGSFIKSIPQDPKGARLGGNRLFYIAPGYKENTIAIINKLEDSGEIPNTCSRHRKNTRTVYYQIRRTGTWTETNETVGPYTKLIVFSSRYSKGSERYVLTDILKDFERYPASIPVYTNTKLIQEGYLQ